MFVPLSLFSYLFNDYSDEIVQALIAVMHLTTIIACVCHVRSEPENDWEMKTRRRWWVIISLHLLARRQDTQKPRSHAND